MTKEKLSITGIQTRLTEISETDAADIVKLRNDPNNNKFLFQKELTVENQIDWIRKNKDRDDARNFKVTDHDNAFRGTISIYNIEDNRGEWGRYIVTNPINAVEAEYLLLKICFEKMGMKAVYGQTNIDNKSAWRQHIKLGFREIEIKEVPVGTHMDVMVRAVIQEITAEEFRAFNYDKILKLLEYF
jgi:RimJ/RimL family protein N-acetyltransferase